MATQHASIKRLRAPLSRFIVDGFNFCEPDVRHYFLTHAHSDHTTGLTASFDLGEVYCSALTARMLRATIGVKAKLIHTIEVGESIEVEGAPSPHQRATINYNYAATTTCNRVTNHSQAYE